MHTTFRIAALALFFLEHPTGFAQATVEQRISQSAAIANPVPSNPAAVLAEAAKVNGLGEASVRPWHIKVSYQSFDSDGDPEHSGSFEEFWISATKYKRSYTSDNFTQTDFATDHGLYRSGDQIWTGHIEMQVSRKLLQPMPAEIDIRQVNLKQSESNFGPVSLSCISLQKKSNVTVQVIGYSDSDVFPRYCFEPGKLVLRFASQGAGHFDTVYNNIVLFQGRYVARDTKITNAGKLLLSLHVENLEEIATVNESDFAPAAGAVGPLGDGTFAESGFLQELLLKPPDPPKYPDSARRIHAQGTVIVLATIGKSGHVIAAKAVDGPFALQEAAVEAVRKMEFRPFRILGQPVDIETKFSIGFHVR